MTKRATSMRIPMLLAAFACPLGPNVASAQAAESKPLLSSLQSLLSDYGKAAAISQTSTLVMKWNSTIKDVSECRAQLRVVDEVNGQVVGVIQSTIDYDLHLPALSPAVTVRRWENYPLYSLRIVTTTGEPSIRRRSSRSPEAGQHYVDIVLADSAKADSAARLLEMSIQACGGQPQTAEAETRAAAADSAGKSRVAAFFGGDLSPDERRDLIAVCQVHVRAELDRSKLAVSETASFPDSAYIMRSKPTELRVLGRVVGKNRYGAGVAGPYICHFQKYGTQFVPTTTVAAPQPQ